MSPISPRTPQLPTASWWEGVSQLLRVLWQARLLVIFNAILFVIFVYTDQGYDMLLALPEGALSRIGAFFLFTAVAAFMVWYCGRFFLDLDYPPEANEQPDTYWAYVVPRYLAVQLPVVMAMALFHLGSYACSHQHRLLLWLLGAFVLPYLIISFLTRWLATLERPWVFWTLMGALLASLVVGAVYDHSHHGSYWIAGGLILLAIILAGYFYIRRHPGFYGYLTFLRNVHPRLIFWAFAGLLGLAFITFNLMDDVGSIFPYTVLISGLTVYLTAIGLLFAVSRKMRLFMLTSVIGLVVILVYLNNFKFNTYLHEVQYAEASPIPLVRQALPDHFDAWLTHRQKKMRQKDPYPVFLLVGEGGGSRAGLWMSHLLSSLQDSTDGAFTEHTYAMSTVSGSTTGAGTFFYFLKNNYGSLGPRSRIMFQTNYLSSSLAHLMGQDALKSIIPGIYPRREGRHRDRAAQIEHEWAIGAWNALRLDESYRLRPPADSSLHQPFTSFWQTYDGQYDLDLPILIANSTRVETGRPAIISPINLASKDPAYNILEHLQADGREISLITGMHLSSRFPIINAAAKLDGLGYFVDGGYYDNSGAATMNNLLDELARYTFNDTFELNLILVRNNAVPQTMNTGNKLQLTSPLQTLLNTRSGHGAHNVESLLQKFSNQTVFTFDLQHDQTQCDVLPLARFLSARAAKIIMADLQEGGNKDNFSKLVQKIKFYEQKNRLSYF